jgi:pyruvate dehydrogenase E2 component (dihydrolipoamide acetyltransferase)
MKSIINMPGLPKPARNGTVRCWRKAEGEQIEKGEILLEIETERAVIEVESTRSATLSRILVAEGETVVPGTPIAELGEPGEGAAAAPSGRAATTAQAATRGPATFSSSEPGTKNAARADADAAGAVTPILMPKAGNDMEEGTIVKWLVAEGDTVKVGDLLFELETDKATMEIESEHAGVVRRIVVPEGETVSVHTPVAYLGDSEAAVDAFIAVGGGADGAAGTALTADDGENSEALAEVSESATSPARRIDARGERERIGVSPAARRMTAERGVDLAAITQGSGPGGRILTSDLGGVGSRVVRRKLTPMRKAIARKLTASVQNAPHFYMKLTVDAVRLLEVYKRQKKICKASLNDLIVLAVARTMAKFPLFRSRIEGDEVVEFPDANVGIAVANEDGLRVPVVMGADRLTLAQLSEETRRLASWAREGSAPTMGKGSLTVSNLGMFRVDEFTAIINPPESAVLAVGAPLEGVKVENGIVRATHLLTLILSSDHRLIDGVMAAKFLARLKEILEEPEGLEKNDE